MAYPQHYLSRPFRVWHGSKSRTRLYYCAVVCLTLMSGMVVWPQLTARLLSSAYLPHRYCYLGNPKLVWGHVIADSLIGAAYLAISITLVYLVHRGRNEIPFHWLFLAFGVFIVACGFTHIMEAVTVWIPLYVLSAAAKAFTALASITTAIMLPFFAPKILLLVQRAKESEQYLRLLESGLSEREAAHGELKRINELLEERVRKRTLELARANGELKTSEKQYRLLFESNPMPMWVFARDTLSFLAVNDAAVRHYGYTREEFMAMTIKDIRPEEDIPKLLGSLSSKGIGLSESEVWRHRKKNGTFIEAEITSYPITVAGQDAELILSHDITEQRQNAENLRQSEEKFARAFRSSPLPITISTEEEGRYLEVNNAFVKVLGYEREEVLGRTSEEIGIWADPGDRSKLLELLEHSGRAEALNTRFRTKLGEERQVQISAERVVLNGTPCVLANTLDVTESLRLEEQFRQAQKMEAVGRLAGGVAHDFNNLLSVIMGYSELSQDATAAGQSVHKHLDQIKKAADRAASLTRQLLAFSRQQVLEPRILNLNAVVNSISQMLLRVIGEDISLSLKPGEPLGSVRADLGQIEQVLMNLVVNARDAMPQGGKIVIETANVDLDETYARKHASVRPGSYVMLSLSDSGCGMDGPTMKKIFEPFFTTKGPGKGTGLGLSTVYGIVKQSGGSIWAYSEPGRGSTFKIYLPRLDSPAEVLAQKKSDFLIDRGTETILVVEDDDSLRALAAELLRGAGYTVFEASDGNSAIEMTRMHQDDIDLVVTDVIMPGMSGADLALRLRELRPGLVILFMSGYASDLIIDAGVPEPERFVLHKPFTRKVLLTKVRSVLGEARVNSPGRPT